MAVSHAGLLVAAAARHMFNIDMNENQPLSQITEEDLKKFKRKGHHQWHPPSILGAIEDYYLYLKRSQLSFAYTHMKNSAFAFSWILES